MKIHTYSEIVISVKNIHEVVKIYTHTLGWAILWQGKGDKSQISFWDLPSDCETEEYLLDFHGLEYGQIRLIEYQNVAQKIIRPAGQTWDTGGILDIDLRTSNIEATAQQLSELSWHAYSKTVTQTMGPFTVEEVLLKGHDEVVIALVHRSNPPHPNPFHLVGVTSNVYLSAMIVRDLEVATNFFVNQLGFKSHNEIEFKTDEPSANMFGMPKNLSNIVNVKLNILGPNETRDGLLDLVEMDGLEGEDFSLNACPPNRGILMYRFPVENVQKYYDFVFKNGVNPVREIMEIEVFPRGKIKNFAVQSPDGVWIEFFQKI
jgi:catechol 2,3-dioxygenase-like lactoylglutathione lyase family enzyme